MTPKTYHTYCANCDSTLRDTTSGHADRKRPAENTDGEVLQSPRRCSQCGTTDQRHLWPLRYNILFKIGEDQFHLLDPTKLLHDYTEEIEGGQIVGHTSQVYTPEETPHQIQTYLQDVLDSHISCYHTYPDEALEDYLYNEPQPIELRP